MSGHRISVADLEAVAHLDVENDIGPEAAVILEFTSNIGEVKSPHELTFITSKGAFVWGGVAAEIAKISDYSDV